MQLVYLFIFSTKRADAAYTGALYRCVENTVDKLKGRITIRTAKEVESKMSAHNDEPVRKTASMLSCVHSFEHKQGFKQTCSHLLLSPFAHCVHGLSERSVPPPSRRTVAKNQSRETGGKSRIAWLSLSRHFQGVVQAGEQWLGLYEQP